VGCALPSAVAQGFAFGDRFYLAVISVLYDFESSDA